MYEERFLKNKTSGFEENNRDITYDWLRIIATLFVVIGHSAYLDIRTEYGGVSYVLPEQVSGIYYSAIFIWFRNFIDWISRFHMPLFFMLSGAVLKIKPIGRLDDIVKSKFKRLLIPYFVCGWFFMLPVKRIGNFYTNDSLKQAMQGFLAGKDSGHLWFLPALFWCILLFVMIQKCFIRVGIKSVYALLLIAGIVQIMYGYLTFDILGLKTGLGYFFYFVLGYVFESEREKSVPWNTKKTLLAFILLVFIKAAHTRYGILNLFFIIICGSFQTFLFSDLCARVFPDIATCRVWKVVVHNLFYIYLFHDPLEYIVLKIFMENGFLAYGTGCVMYAVSRTIVVIVVSMLIGKTLRFIKKNGYQFLSDKTDNVI